MAVAPCLGATHYVDLNSPGPASPYSSWSTAATNIQDAVDAATAGDLILVTNGLYQTGARAMYGMSNRVAVTSAVTVQSVNGPGVTTIAGYPIAGSAAVRCVYLTNGATLTGFTLTNGATQTSGDYYQQESGGGAWCESGGVLSNCVLAGNSAYDYGAGVYSGTLFNCTLTNNSAFNGGGAAYATLTECAIMGNSAGYNGGGTYYGTYTNCTTTGNMAVNNGGGIFQGTAVNCAVTANSAANYSGGADSCTLYNCTIAGNFAGNAGGGASTCILRNCILYYNIAPSPAANYYGSSTLNYCCTTPLPSSGTGNLSADPQLASGFHLSAASSCRGAGSAAYASGVDIDGESWASPPSIGCDEYRSGFLTGPLSAAISADYTNVAIGFGVSFEAQISGLASASRWDFGDGVVVSNQPYANHAWALAGDYVVELRAYNESSPGGVAAYIPMHVVAQPVHYVSVDSLNPLLPYSDWSTAATNIQDAVDAAVEGGALVLVSNGIYQTRARLVYGMSNRVAVARKIIVQSLNGPSVTTIAGHQMSGGPNGAAAVRCAYLTNGAVLTGFTLTNGATQSSGDTYKQQSGGGVWCESASAVVSNCMLVGNSASSYGAGAYNGTLNNCTLAVNSATTAGGGAAYATLNNCTLAANSARSSGGGAVAYATLNSSAIMNNWTGGQGGGANTCTLSNCTLAGNSANTGGGAFNSTLDNCAIANNWTTNNGGGAYNSTLNNCSLTGNSATNSGGGAYWRTLNNCTLTGNFANSGGGAFGNTLNNCIAYYNNARLLGANYDSSSTLNYCCTTPLPSGGTGNLASEPQLASPSHLSPFSPCRGAGSNAYSSGVDIDGDPWANPPSIGCEEYGSGSMTRALTVAISAGYTNVAPRYGVNFVAIISGRLSASRWDFADGVVVRNRPYASHAWAAPGDYVVELRAYNESSPTGVAAAITVHVGAEVHYVAVNSPNPVFPYSDWSTAATNIQNAVDAAAIPGSLVLVSNGVYQTGGRAIYFMSNRLAITKPIIVQSINGPGLTTIYGSGGLSSTAVRCVYLTNGAVLGGFTLANGGTHISSSDAQGSGGGVWCESPSALVSNCVLTGNSAYYAGAGAFSGTLNNCTLTAGNGDLSGGGEAYSTLNNCTVTGNSAQFGGGTYYGTLNNCIVYYNTSVENGIQNYGPTMNYCCTTPLPPGVGNIANPPAFINQAAGNWHLQSNSPCINSGNNAYAPGATDLDGLPRVSGSTVDIGAYEFQNPASIISYAWLQKYGLSTDGSADFVDTDGDGMNNWQEWRTGTSPVDPGSVMRMSGIAVTTNGPNVSWQSVSGITYFLQRSTNLTVQPAFSFLQTNIPGQAGTMSYTDTNAPRPGPWFYRVGVQ